jgi:hypothetical protein
MRDHERDQVQPDPHPVRRPRDVEEAGRDAGPAPARGEALDASAVLRLQRTAGNRGVVQMLAGDEERSPVHDVVGGAGKPLDEGTRSTMESAFGTSFEDVRVHTDDAASKSAESVGANAYTVGSDMVFKAGHFDPGTQAGQKTIAHELAHVVQQSEGPVDGAEAPGGIRVSDPSDRFEQAADRQADRAVASMSVGPGPSPSPASGGEAVQREDEASAEAHVQREAAPVEDEEREEQG